MAILTLTIAPWEASSAGKIQGHPANMLVTVFSLKSISPVLKWVDDFVFFCAPSHSYLDAKGTIQHLYLYDLASILDIKRPLGIPWHPIEAKGQDFGPMVSYVGFVWDLEHHSVSLSPKKCNKYLTKVRSLYMPTFRSFHVKTACLSSALSNISL